MKTSQIHQTIFTILTSRMHGGDTNAKFKSEETILNIIQAAQTIFNNEDSLLELHGNFTVVGDIHGNIDDLLRIFEHHGYPPETNYLFLGDYVDRGTHSIEVIILLLCLKILFPNSLYMIRGNHECESITTVYGFKRDCNIRFGSSNYSCYSYYQEGTKIYKKFMECFEYLSYAAVINDEYFCVHGGISQYLKAIDDISELYKPMISADSELATDLVWSDPCRDSYGFTPSNRGAGHYFDDAKLNKFLFKNGLKKLIRSHESCMNGVDYPLDNCITIFSNSDYCGMNNKAAVINIRQDSDETDPSPSDDPEDSYALNVSDDNSNNGKDEDDSLKIEVFNALSRKEMKMRRVIIPEWLLTSESNEIVPLKEQGSIYSKELLDALSTPPLS